jgi:hypothetical protein
VHFNTIVSADCSDGQPFEIRQTLEKAPFAYGEDILQLTGLIRICRMFPKYSQKALLEFYNNLRRERNRVGIGLSYRPASAGVLDQSGNLWGPLARNLVGIELSYRPARGGILKHLWNTRIDIKNRFHQPMYLGGPVRQLFPTWSPYIVQKFQHWLHMLA